MVFRILRRFFASCRQTHGYPVCDVPIPYYIIHAIEHGEWIPRHSQTLFTISDLHDSSSSQNIVSPAYTHNRTDRLIYAHPEPESIAYQNALDIQRGRVVSNTPEQEYRSGTGNQRLENNVQMALQNQSHPIINSQSSFAGHQHTNHERDYVSGDLPPTYESLFGQPSVQYNLEEPEDDLIHQTNLICVNQYIPNGLAETVIESSSFDAPMTRTEVEGSIDLYPVPGQWFEERLESRSPNRHMASLYTQPSHGYFVPGQWSR